MSTVYIIEAFNRFAAVFAVLNYVFAVFLGYERTNGLLYIWVSIFACLMVYIKKTRRRAVIVPGILMFSPLILSSNMYETGFMLIVFGLGVFYVLRDMGGFDFHKTLDNFYKELTAIIVIAAISLFLGSISVIGKFCAQYILIQFVSYTVLLRTLRYQSYDRNNKQFNRINGIYTVSVAAFAFIISVDAVRNFMGSAVVLIYNGIISVFFLLFNWIFLGLGYVLEIIAKKILSGADQGMLDKVLGGIPKGQKTVKPDLSTTSYNPAIVLILKIIVLIVVIGMLVKIIKRMATRSREENDGEFIEQKEFIERQRIGKNNLYSKIKNIMHPRNYDEYIRMYYIKFLRLLLNRGVELNSSDTALDVNNKSKGIYDAVILDNIRNIYIKIRYGHETGDKTMVKEISTLYKQLKK